ncbi:hypothetical protein [Flavobacterium sp. 1355]|uniref:hypothetical protein n=1 Tax=Flavobacterium sp. 1355 TaxID=2806571 RepID=UPI001AE8922F|nr:hypothetical protein [Flavobacterium sp. 1355]MBP1225830.1 hypothetical protein [Flavobacterium sp. 1355]
MKLILIKMGWDTQIIIIVENIQNEEREITLELYQSDANSYFHNGLSFAKFKLCSDETKVLFFTYERRKYLPYWAIQDISLKYPGKYFTAIGSSLDFNLGPAGIIKILNGEIIDSYGFWKRELEVTEFLENPIPEALYQWFGKDKLEEQLRELHLDKQPKKWIQDLDLYAENIIEFTEQQNQQFIEIVNYYTEIGDNWEEIKLTEDVI